eukprot:TRINITY_DN3549_c0_g1_i2.p1 TRINITY_DN3549_c0_g1~~TRINITY_DN3549_c0_g1_i2.p1  ORF type:complete len:322 (-),score=63.99 TRINITY_DN3549_c0_g1_i2:26-910(-)
MCIRDRYMGNLIYKTEMNDEYNEEFLNGQGFIPQSDISMPPMLNPRSESMNIGMVVEEEKSHNSLKPEENSSSLRSSAVDATDSNQGIVYEDDSQHRPLIPSTARESFDHNTPTVDTFEQYISTSHSSSEPQVKVTSKESKFAHQVSRSLLEFLIKKLDTPELTDALEIVMERDQALVRDFKIMLIKQQKEVRRVNWKVWLELTQYNSKEYLSERDCIMDGNQLFQKNKRLCVQAFSTLIRLLFDEFKSELDKVHKLMPVFREYVTKAIWEDPCLFLTRPLERLVNSGKIEIIG